MDKVTTRRDSEKQNAMTPLQKHVSFFDRDNDGIIMPHETWSAFRDLGFGYCLSLLGVLFIHGSMSYPSLDTWVPDPTFPIYVKNISHCVHGSDSNVYDHDGNARTNILMSLYNQYGGQHKSMDLNGNESVIQGFSFWQGVAMVKHGWDVLDPFGRLASIVEWSFLYILANKNGIVPIEAIKGQYDGSLFYSIAEERKRMINK